MIRNRAWNRIGSVCLGVCNSEQRKMSFEFRESDLCQFWHRLILNLIIAAYHPDCIFLPSKFRIAAVASSSSSSVGTVAIAFILAHELNMFTCGEAFRITAPASKPWFAPTDVESATDREPIPLLLPKKFTSRDYWWSGLSPWDQSSYVVWSFSYQGLYYFRSL